MIKRYLRILNAEIKLNLKDTFSYKVGVLSDIIVMAILYFSCLFTVEPYGPLRDPPQETCFEACSSHVSIPLSSRMGVKAP